jgi:acyl-CoA synthetase (AMP-forming)/AMP-acid ligase II
MDEIAPNTFECVALDGLKSKSTINSDDPPNSFRTRDLFMQHPTRPGLWKYISRLDDRFTLTMGEKVLPLLMEGQIRHAPCVQEACVFGEGRPVPGVIVVKAENAAGMSDHAFMETVWPAIEGANRKAESFARVPKELVIVLPANTAYPKTDKGTFVRAQMYLQFKHLTDAAYADFANGEQGGTLSLAGEDLENWLLEKFKDYLDVKLEPETDFFSAGVDSLQCLGCEL